jgi:hypothetical protein
LTQGRGLDSFPGLGIIVATRLMLALLIIVEVVIIFAAFIVRSMIIFEL